MLTDPAMREDIYRAVGLRVRRERKRLGWTLEELGERCGMHPGYIGQLERGVKKVSLAALARIAEALGAPVGALLDERQPRAETWESKIGGLLRDKPERERRVLYSTLRHLARQMRVASPRR